MSYRIVHRGPIMGKRNAAGRYTAEGLPRDAREWTEADWRTLWEHYKAIIAEIGGRHKEWTGSESSEPGDASASPATNSE